MQREKEIFNLREELKKANLRHERELRVGREEQKKLASRHSEGLGETFEREKEEIVRKYESRLSEKTRMITAQ